MAVNNAYAQYNNNKVLTASPAELTLLLYEGAIKFCNIAIMGMEENNIQKTPTKLYSYIYGLLVDANVHKDREVLERALNEIRGMRDTWKEVMRLNKNS